jgi:Arc/MetJ family transcription regulator
MRTTLDIPDELLREAGAVSGRRTKRGTVCWALQEALRRKAREDLLARKVKIEFAVTPAQLETWEAQPIRGRRRVGSG